MHDCCPYRKRKSGPIQTEGEHQVKMKAETGVGFTSQGPLRTGNGSPEAGREACARLSFIVLEGANLRTPGLRPAEQGDDTFLV
jgi:hypothetical protein